MDWTEPKNEGDTFFFDFSRKKQTQLMHPLDAAFFTIDYITKNYPPPYTLLLSGGVDSQAMLYGWHLSKVPFETCSAVYNYNLNHHDLSTLKEFSTIHNIKINFVDFDLFNFLENEFERYSDLYLCGSPQICAHMKIADSIKEGTAIMSGNFIENNSLKPLTTNVITLWHYKRLSNKPSIPFFFLETEELAWSFNSYSIDPINLPNLSNPAYIQKVKALHHYGFPVIPQEKKYNGFEKVKVWYDENYKKPIPLPNKLIRIAGQGSNRIFDLLYRNKYEAKFSKYKYVKNFRQSSKN